MPESSLGGVPTFCLCGLHDSLTYEYLKKNCKTSLLHFYLIIINIMLLFIRTSQANPNPNHNNTITHGPRPECSPHAPPVPTPSYGIPCSLLGQRPGAFNCPLSVVMEENFFQYVPCPVYPERPCSGVRAGFAAFIACSLSACAGKIGDLAPVGAACSVTGTTGIAWGCHTT